MKVEITKSFSSKLKKQVELIAIDKPFAARQFKNDVLREIKSLPKLPYKGRKSIFFEREDIREIVFKGYLIVYKVNKSEKAIEVFGFTKWENDPFDQS